MNKPKKFGALLRELRQQKNMGIKKVAPELGVNYTYLSKLENGKALPSDELIDRIATYFGFDKDLLYISADRLPQDALEAIRRQPKEALDYLRSLPQDVPERSR